MIRLGGGPGNQLPPPDEKAERQMANAAVVGNVTIFGVLIVAINALPFILEPLGFEVY